MPYSRAWSLAAPLGTVQAKDIDLLIRQHKEDMEERLESTLVVDMAADPLVLRDEVKGAHAGKVWMLSANAFQTLQTEFDDGLGRKFDDDHLHADIPLLAGNTIKKIEVLVMRTGGSLITLSLKRQAFSIGVANPANVMTINSLTGVAIKHIIQLDPVNHLIDVGYMYYIELVGDSGARTYVFGARITYDSPSTLAAF